MKSRFFKHPKHKGIAEVTDLNTVNIYLREGFVDVEAKGKPIEEEKTEEKSE